MSTEIIYKDSVIETLEAGDITTLHTKDTKFTDDLIIKAEVDSGTIPEGYIKPSGTKNITTNGTVNVASFEFANVTVPQTTLTELAVNKNGTYEADEGHAYRKVSVAVNADPILQEKTIKPSTDEQTVAADNGYNGLSKVIVEAIQTEEKTVTPTKGTQTIKPNSADYLSEVIVEPIPDEYVIPSGSVTLTENGEHDISGKATAVVDVPIPEGYIEPSGSLDITSNGEHDVREYESVVVDVPIPDEYIVPEGNMDITENGVDIDVSQYATVSVDVPIPDGYIVPEGDLEITENGTRDVSEYATVTVNVEGAGGSPLPIEINSELEMTALLETAEPGSVYKYMGTTGTYINGALYVVEEEAVTLISFTIDGTTYYAEEDMTWGEWLPSDYNRNHYWIEGASLGEGTYVADVLSTDLIVSGNVYHTEYVSWGGSN